MRLLPLLACGLVGTVVPLSASAQSTPLQGVLWLPSLSIDPDAMPHVEGTRVPGSLNWNASVAIEILERPYTGEDASRSRFSLVGHQLWTHFMVQLGIFSQASVAVELPVMLSQSGDVASLGQSSLGSVGFGDVRATFRWSTRASAPARSRGPDSPSNRVATNTFTNDGPALSVVVSGTAPTGEGRSFTGYNAWTLHPSLVGDLRLFGLIIAGQVGYRARFDSHWPAQQGTCPPEPGTSQSVSCLAQVPLRDAITYSLGLRLPQALLYNIAGIYLEMFGQWDARAPFSPRTSPLELGLGFQRTFSNSEIYATLGVSTGVTNAPGNPRFAALAMLHWAPRFIDEDGDGLRDNTGEDQCVGLPEDFDNFEDTDGCPEDNDTDDVPDAEDRCPTVNEDSDEFEDEDGCPDPDNDADGVPDTADACVNGAMGPYPDESRPGCPNDDIDGDGLANGDDQCPDQARGTVADPARAGCPAPDGDQDRVPDADDACPDQPAGENAVAQQRGCPDLDPDHDGVPTVDDRCADQSETINGVQDEDGCPETPAPRTARPRVRVAARSGNSPGGVVLLEPVRFLPNDSIDRARRAPHRATRDRDGRNGAPPVAHVHADRRAHTGVHSRSVRRRCRTRRTSS